MIRLLARLAPSRAVAPVSSESIGVSNQGSGVDQGHRIRNTTDRPERKKLRKAP